MVCGNCANAWKFLHLHTESTTRLLSTGNKISPVPSLAQKSTRTHLMAYYEILVCFDPKLARYAADGTLSLFSDTCQYVHDFELFVFKLFLM